MTCLMTHWLPALPPPAGTLTHPRWGTVTLVSQAGLLHAGCPQQALLCSGPQFAMWDLITSISQNEDLAPYMVCEMILGGHRVK